MAGNMESLLYERKLQDMKKYIPFLVNLMDEIRNKNDKTKDVQLKKMQALHTLLTNRTKRLNLNNLLKCEGILKKLQLKVEPTPKPGEIVDTSAFEKIDSPDVSAPASPQLSDKNFVARSPILIPTERKDSPKPFDKRDNNDKVDRNRSFSRFDRPTTSSGSSSRDSRSDLYKRRSPPATSSKYRSEGSSSSYYDRSDKPSSRWSNPSRFTDSSKLFERNYSPSFDRRDNNQIGSEYSSDVREKTRSNYSSSPFDEVKDRNKSFIDQKLFDKSMQKASEPVDDEENWDEIFIPSTKPSNISSKQTNPVKTKEGHSKDVISKNDRHISPDSGSKDSSTIFSRLGSKLDVTRPGSYENFTLKIHNTKKKLKPQTSPIAEVLKSPPLSANDIDDLMSESDQEKERQKKSEKSKKASDLEAVKKKLHNDMNNPKSKSRNTIPHDPKPSSTKPHNVAHPKTSSSSSSTEVSKSDSNVRLAFKYNPHPRKSIDTKITEPDPLSDAKLAASKQKPQDPRINRPIITALPGINMSDPRIRSRPMNYMMNNASPMDMNNGQPIPVSPIPGPNINMTAGMVNPFIAGDARRGMDMNMISPTNIPQDPRRNSLEYHVNPFMAGDMRRGLDNNDPRRGMDNDMRRGMEADVRRGIDDIRRGIDTDPRRFMDIDGRHGGDAINSMFDPRRNVNIDPRRGNIEPDLRRNMDLMAIDPRRNIGMNTDRRNIEIDFEPRGGNDPRRNTDVNNFNNSFNQPSDPRRQSEPAFSTMSTQMSSAGPRHGNNHFKFFNNNLPHPNQQAPNPLTVNHNNNAIMNQPPAVNFPVPPARKPQDNVDLGYKKFHPVLNDQVERMKYIESKRTKPEPKTYGEYRQARLEKKKKKIDNDSSSSSTEVSENSKTTSPPPTTATAAKAALTPSCLDAMYKKGDYNKEVHVTGFKIPKLNKSKDEDHSKETNDKKASDISTKNKEKNLKHDKTKDKKTDSKEKKKDKPTSSFDSIRTENVKANVADEEENWDDDLPAAPVVPAVPEPSVTHDVEEDDTEPFNIIKRSKNKSKKKEKSSTGSKKLTDEKYTPTEEVPAVDLKEDNNEELKQQDSRIKESNQQEDEPKQQDSKESDDSKELESKTNDQEIGIAQKQHKSRHWFDFPASTSDGCQLSAQNIITGKRRSKPVKQFEISPSEPPKITKRRKSVISSAIIDLDEPEFILPDSLPVSPVKPPSKRRKSVCAEVTDVTKEESASAIDDHPKPPPRKIVNRRQTICSRATLADDTDVISNKIVDTDQPAAVTSRKLMQRRKSFCAASAAIATELEEEMDNSMKTKTRKVNKRRKSVCIRIDDTDDEAIILPRKRKSDVYDDDDDKCKDDVKNDIKDDAQINAISSTTPGTTEDQPGSAKSVKLDTDNKSDLADIKKENCETTTTTTSTITTKKEELTKEWLEEFLVNIFNSTIVNQSNVLTMLEKVLDEKKFQQIKQIVEETDDNKTKIDDNNINKHDEAKDDEVNIEKKDKPTEDDIKENELEQKADSHKNNKRHKTELDRLNEDIRDMFISQGVLTATGRRMCTIIKENKKEDEVLPQNTKKKQTNNNKKKEAASAKSKVSKAVGKVKKVKKRRGRKPKAKAYLDETESLASTFDENNLDDDDDDDFDDHKNEELDVTDEEPQQIDEEQQQVEIETYESNAHNAPYLEMPELQAAYPTSKPGTTIDETKQKSKKKKYKPCPKSKRKKQYSEDEGQDTEDEILSTEELFHITVGNKSTSFTDDNQDNTKKSAKSRGPRGLKSDFSLTEESLINMKNINPEMHSKSMYINKCVICGFSGRYMSNHYIQAHPTFEVLISRLPIDVLQLIKNDQINDALLMQRKSSDKSHIAFKFKCPFCDLESCLTRKAWEHHFGIHTGEYSFKCSNCSKVHNSKKVMDQHIKKCGTGAIVERIRDKPKPGRPAREVVAYVCNLCNYIQMSQSNVIKHLNEQHEDDKNFDKNKNIENYCDKITLLNCKKITIPKRGFNNSDDNDSDYINDINDKDDDMLFSDQLQVFTGQDTNNLNIDDNFMNSYDLSLNDQSTTIASTASASASTTSIVDTLGQNQINNNEHNFDSMFQHSIFNDMSIVDRLSERFKTVEKDQPKDNNKKDDEPQPSTSGMSMADLLRKRFENVDKITENDGDVCIIENKDDSSLKSPIETDKTHDENLNNVDTNNINNNPVPSVLYIVDKIGDQLTNGEDLNEVEEIAIPEKDDDDDIMLGSTSLINDNQETTPIKTLLNNAKTSTPEKDSSSKIKSPHLNRAMSITERLSERLQKDSSASIYNNLFNCDKSQPSTSAAAFEQTMPQNPAAASAINEQAMPQKTASLSLVERLSQRLKSSEHNNNDNSLLSPSSSSATSTPITDHPDSLNTKENEPKSRLENSPLNTSSRIFEITDTIVIDSSDDENEGKESTIKEVSIVKDIGHTRTTNNDKKEKNEDLDSSSEGNLIIDESALELSNNNQQEIINKDNIKIETVTTENVLEEEDTNTKNTNQNIDENKCNDDDMDIEEAVDDEGDNNNINDDDNDWEDIEILPDKCTETTSKRTTLKTSKDKVKNAQMVYETLSKLYATIRPAKSKRDKSKKLKNIGKQQQKQHDQQQEKQQNLDDTISSISHDETSNDSNRTTASALVVDTVSPNNIDENNIIGDKNNDTETNDVNIQNLNDGNSLEKCNSNLDDKNSSEKSINLSEDKDISENLSSSTNINVEQNDVVNNSSNNNETENSTTTTTTTITNTINENEPEKSFPDNLNNDKNQPECTASTTSPPSSSSSATTIETAIPSTIFVDNENDNSPSDTYTNRQLDEISGLLGFDPEVSPLDQIDINPYTQQTIGVPLGLSLDINSINPTIFVLSEQTNVQDALGLINVLDKSGESSDNNQNQLQTCNEGELSTKNDNNSSEIVNSQSSTSEPISSSQSSSNGNKTDDKDGIEDNGLTTSINTPHSNSNPPIHRIDNLGYSKAGLALVKYHCLIESCSFLYSNLPIGLKNHFLKEHKSARWQGYCRSCESQVVDSENMPLSKELLHMQDVHLNLYFGKKMLTPPQKPLLKIRRFSGDTLSAKINDNNTCQKSEEESVNNFLQLEDKQSSNDGEKTEPHQYPFIKIHNKLYEKEKELPLLHFTSVSTKVPIISKVNTVANGNTSNDVMLKQYLVRNQLDESEQQNDSSIVSQLEGIVVPAQNKSQKTYLITKTNKPEIKQPIIINNPLSSPSDLRISSVTHAGDFTPTITKKNDEPFLKIAEVVSLFKSTTTAPETQINTGIKVSDAVSIDPCTSKTQSSDEHSIKSTKATDSSASLTTASISNTLNSVTVPPQSNETFPEISNVFSIAKTPTPKISNVVTTGPVKTLTIQTSQLLSVVTTASSDNTSVSTLTPTVSQISSPISTFNTSSSSSTGNTSLRVLLASSSLPPNGPVQSKPGILQVCPSQSLPSTTRSIYKPLSSSPVPSSSGRSVLKPAQLKTIKDLFKYITDLENGIRILKNVGPAILKPWTFSTSIKSHLVVQKLLSEKCLFSLYKCMGNECTYYTNYMPKMAAHLSLHSDILGSTSGLLPDNGTKHSWRECCYCSERFTTNTILLEHIQNLHSKDIYQCGYCFYRSCVGHNVVVHINTFHKDRTISILLCNGEQRKLSTEIRDLAARRAQNVRPIPCNKCRSSFYILRNYIKHIQEAHESVTDYKCQLCHTNLHKDQAEKHLVAKHQIGIYECIYCLFATVTMDLMRIHMSNAHPSSLSYMCVRLSPNRNLKVEVETLESSTVLANLAEPVDDKYIIRCPYTSLQMSTQDLSLEESIVIPLDNTTAESLPSSAPQSQLPLIQTTQPLATPPSTAVLRIPSKQPSNDLAIASVQTISNETFEKLDVANNSSTPNNTLPLPPPAPEPESVPEYPNPYKFPSAEHMEQDIKNKVNARILDAANEMVNGTGFTEPDLYKCCVPACKFKYNNKIAEFCSHVTEHASQANLTELKCYHCYQPFKTVLSLKAHLKVHAIHRYFCYFCNYTGAQAYNVLKHISYHTKSAIVTQPLISGKVNKNKDFFVLCQKHIRPQDIMQYGERLARAVDKKKALTKKYFEPDEIDMLPRQAIFYNEVFCKICDYRTKVRTNMFRHLQFHKQELNVAPIDPVNPVPCLNKDERHFDRMQNLACSSNNSKDGGKSSNEPEIPEYIPASKRFVCGVAGCTYLNISESMLKCHLTALHSDEKSYICPHCSLEICKKSFCADKILTHLKCHDVKLFVCGTCFYMHHQKHIVERHISEKHQGTSAILSYERNGTDTIKTTEQITKNNKETGNTAVPSPQPAGSEMKWECGLCKAKRPTYNQMVCHMNRTHEVKNRYQCIHCDFGGAQIKSIVVHIAEKHPTKVKEARCMFYKVNENPSEIQQQDNTTPIWTRDANRVKNIRGILMEDEEESQRNLSINDSSYVDDDDEVYNDANTIPEAVSEKDQSKQDTTTTSKTKNDDSSSSKLNATFNCDLCSFFGKTALELKHHTNTFEHRNIMIEDVDDLYAFFCFHCMYKVPLANLREHWKSSHSSKHNTIDELTKKQLPFWFRIAPQVACGHCQFKSVTVNVLRHHSLVHGNLNIALRNVRNLNKCSQCPFVFDTIKNLMIHFKANHPKATEPNIAINDTLLNKLLKHGYSYKYIKCLYCKEIPIGLESYLEHHNTKHLNKDKQYEFVQGQPLYLCSHCTFLSDEETTIRHMYTHEFNCNYKCQTCLVKFNSFMKFSKHLKDDHNSRPNQLTVFVCMNNKIKQLNEVKVVLPNGLVIPKALLGQTKLGTSDVIKNIVDEEYADYMKDPKEFDDTTEVESPLSTKTAPTKPKSKKRRASQTEDSEKIQNPKKALIIKKDRPTTPISTSTTPLSTSTPNISNSETSDIKLPPPPPPPVKKTEKPDLSKIFTKMTIGGRDVPISCESFAKLVKINCRVRVKRERLDLDLQTGKFVIPIKKTINFKKKDTIKVKKIKKTY